MVTGTSPFAPSVGSLVQVRGRDWVVLPSQDPEVLNLRPLSGEGGSTGSGEVHAQADFYYERDGRPGQEKFGAEFLP